MFEFLSGFVGPFVLGFGSGWAVGALMVMLGDVDPMLWISYRWGKLEHLESLLSERWRERARESGKPWKGEKHGM